MTRRARNGTRRRASLSLSSALLGVALLASPSQAVRPTAGPDFADAALADTAPPPRVAFARRPPAAAAAAWQRFEGAAGPRWRALWDADLAVPRRIIGPGIAAPGSVASAAAAERAARRVLADHLDLLAPGASAADFVLAANHERGGLRTVAFTQRSGGLPVVGGQVSFRFRRDRMFVIASRAVPLAPPRRQRTAAAMVDRERAVEPARAAITSALGAGVTVTASAAGAPVVLPVARAGGVVEGRLAYEVVVSSTRPTRHSVWIDAETLEPLARRSLLSFAEGTLLYDTPIRHPGAERVDHPASRVTVDLDGTPTTADAAGLLTWPGPRPRARIVTAVSGPWVQVINFDGSAASTELVLRDGQSARWSAADDEFVDAQLTTFIHLGRVREFARTLDPGLLWLGQQMLGQVNVDGICNAYSDGNSVRFFRGSTACENTGRLPDVVYHEFGHGLHGHAIIPGAGYYDSALSEGVSDYLAATMTGDPGMGRGFFRSEEPLRQLDPPDQEARWPEDIGLTPHLTGLIVGGALWDLRTALIADLGEEAGRALADGFYYAVLERAEDIPTTYIEVLVADDDDGDLDNGTPHDCAIDAAFAPHGLADPAATGVVATPRVLGREVSVAVQAGNNDCPALEVDAMELRWRLRGESDDTTIDMTDAGDVYRAVLPEHPPGTVVEYQVDARFADDSVRTAPANAADPWYELYLGDTVPLYCTTFDVAPSEDGWTHGTHEGPDLGDWQWGDPRNAPGTGDPDDAWSGNTAYGTDLGFLGEDGLYESSEVSYTDMPTVAVPETASGVRLQYRRWLSVEDAHYDVATISNNGGAVWSNRRTDDGSLHHTDREWRFHDVDLTETVYDGEVNVRFEIASDSGFERGGWTLDDVCIVAVMPPCGEDGGAPCPVGEGDGGVDVPITVGGGCGCRAGGSGAAGSVALLLFAALLRQVGPRRRRRTPAERTHI